MVSSLFFRKFENDLGIDLLSFFQETKDFFDLSFPNIYGFYSGLSRVFPEKDIEKLDSLLLDTMNIIQTMKVSSDSLDSTEYFEAFEMIDDIKTKLQTTTKIKKWLRSSINKSTYNNDFSVELTLKSNQTIEEAVVTLKGATSEEEINQIILQNDLQERDYDMSGGVKLNVPNKSSVTGVKITGVVDELNGEKIYGRDINRTITFVNDDIEVLDYVNTLNQTVDILSSLNKGAIPEFPEIGVDLLVGKNLGILSKSMIARQIKETYLSDDLFKDAPLDEMIYDQGDVFIKYRVLLVNNVSLPKETTA